MSLIFKDVNNLARELDRLNHLKFNTVVKKNMTQIYNRGKKNLKKTGEGTPVGEYPKPKKPRKKKAQRKGGQLMGSLGQSGDTVSYSKEYAAHVEYGHRTRGGGWVAGQRYLMNNVDKQRPIFEDDLKKHLKRK